MSGPDRSRVVLVDGNALLYRAHYAFIAKPLTNSKGFETSGLFGFVRMLFDIKDKYSPEYIVVAWDKTKKNFRHELFPEYKGTRKETPPPLVAQFPIARQLLDALGIKSVEIDRFEADDLIGTLAKRFRGQAGEVLMVSGDRDILQLVDDTVHAVLTKRGISELALYTPETVKTEVGLDVSQLIDLKALVGDLSDNIPGVKGIGEKTAVKLLAEHGNLDRLYEAVPTMKGANATKLAAAQSDAMLSRTLGTINTEVPIELSIEDCKPAPVKQAELIALFTELELRQFLQRPEIKQAVEAVAKAVAGEWITVIDEAGLAAAIADLEKATRVSLMVLTAELGRPRLPVIGIALARVPERAYYVPLGHQYLGAPEQLDTAHVLAKLQSLLEFTPVVGSNLKFELNALARHGIEIALGFDTMLASYLLNPNRRRHTLDELSAEFLGLQLAPVSEVIPNGHDYCQVSVEKAAAACGAVVTRALDLASLLETRLADVQLTRLFRDIEMPLSRILSQMERTGIAIDPAYLATLGAEMSEEIARIEKEVFTICGETFNLSSPSQLATVLFEKLKLPVIKKTKTGYSTDSDVLAALEHDHQFPVARLINTHRHLTKLKGTYVDALPKLIDPVDGRIHTTYDQAVAATGRLSSVDPNLQNIPIRTAVGHKIRRAFKAAAGHQFVSADYSQIELRILAHLADSPFLKNAFASNEDIHRRTASRMFGIPEDQLTSDLRNRAKAINFGILYGQSAFGLSRTVGISQTEARTFMQAYFAQFPEVRTYLDTQIELARKQGFVTTLLNRRRYLHEIHSKNGQERAFAERIAVNTPIQGSAADLIKIAMVRVDQRLAEDGFQAKMLLQIHDELVFEAPDAEVERLIQMVRKTMERALDLTVPVVVNVSHGRTWAELK